MRTILLAVLLALLFSGCNEKLVFVKPPCFEIQSIEQPVARAIRVDDRDIELYRAYIEEFRGKIDNQNLITQRLNENCTKWELKKEE
jgi:hypothetical protein